MSNPYWDRITAVANKQRDKGIAEYGRGIEDDTADINVRLNRIEEELIDALMYIEHLRDGINKPIISRDKLVDKFGDIGYWNDFSEFTLEEIVNIIDSVLDES